MAGIATLAAQTPRPTTPPPMAVVTDLEPPGPPKIYRARMPVFTLVDTNVRYLPNRVITPSLGDLSAMVEQPRTVKSDGNVFIGASSKLPGSLTSPAFLIYIKKGKEVDSGIAVWETPNGNHLGVVSNYEFGPRFPRIASPPIIGASLLEKMQAAEAAKQAGSKKDGESSLKEGSETSSKDDIECGTNNDSESSFKNSSKTSFENHSQTSKNGSYASSNTASKTTFDPTMAPFYMASLLRLNPTLHKTLYQKTMDDIIAEFDAAQCVHPARYTVFVAKYVPAHLCHLASLTVTQPPEPLQQ